jgi:TonB family protein
MATESPVVIPQSLDDISTPDLDESAVKNVAAETMDEKDLSEDLNKVDDQHRKLVALEQKKMNDDAEQAEQENAAALAEVEKENQNEKARIAALNQARRNAEAKNIAAAQAAEKAGQERAAAREAAAAAAAMAAKNAAQNGNGDGTGDAENASAGTPQGEIRQLADLKQMPGNRKPMYDVNERLKGHQGTAIFMAYISKEGRTGQFKLVQSSGYRNLDAKTLAALKQWKFYPGQEGWVEMPIQWDLKGGVQEKPTLLRRSTY